MKEYTEKYKKVLTRNIILISVFLVIMFSLIFLRYYINNHTIHGRYEETTAEIVNVEARSVEKIVGRIRGSENLFKMKQVEVYDLDLKYKVDGEEYAVALRGVERNDAEKMINGVKVYYQVSNPNHVKIQFYLERNVNKLLWILVIMSIAAVLRLMDKIIHKELYL